jgi:hypothetical protein
MLEEWKSDKKEYSRVGCRYDTLSPASDLRASEVIVHHLYRSKLVLSGALTDDLACYDDLETDVPNPKRRGPGV